jgi:hypothetical protein
VIGRVVLLGFAALLVVGCDDSTKGPCRDRFLTEFENSCPRADHQLRLEQQIWMCRCPHTADGGTR